MYHKRHEVASKVSTVFFFPFVPSVATFIVYSYILLSASTFFWIRQGILNYCATALSTTAEVW